MSTTGISALPRLSFIEDAKDLVQAGQVSKEISELAIELDKIDPSLYGPLIQYYFPYRKFSKAHPLELKSVLFDEYKKWTELAKFTGSATGMDVSILLSALRGEYRRPESGILNNLLSIIPGFSEKTNENRLSKADQEIVDLVEAVGNYLRTEDQPELYTLDFELAHMICVLTKGKHIAHLNQNKKLKDHIDGFLYATMTIFMRPFNEQVLRTQFESRLINDTVTGQSVFDKIKKLSLEQLYLLKDILFNIVVKFENFENLSKEQQELYTSILPTQNDIALFQPYCEEYYDVILSKVNPHNNFIVEWVNTQEISDQLMRILDDLSIDYLAIFYDQINNKLNSEIKRLEKEAKQVTTKPAITPALSHHKEKSKSKSKKDNSNTLDAPNRRSKRKRTSDAVNDSDRDDAMESTPNSSSVNHTSSSSNHKRQKRK